jgi:hypothetical protein
LNDGISEPTEVALTLPAAAAGTVHTLHGYLIRGQYPIEAVETEPVEVKTESKEQNKEKNIFKRAGNGFKKGINKGVNKVVAAKEKIAAPVKKRLDNLVRVAGDNKPDIKNPVPRFIGKRWTNHVTRNSKKRTFERGGTDPIAIATVTVKSSAKQQQVKIQLPKVDAVRHGDSVYLVVFVTSGDSSTVGTAAFNERLVEPEAVYYYDISADADCTLADDIDDNFDGFFRKQGLRIADFMNKLNEFNS